MPILINQNIPESKKDTKWCEKNVLGIVNAARGLSQTKIKDIACWKLYNEQQDLKDFDYLRKYGDYELPSHVRHIGIQRPCLELLKGRQARRNFIFSLMLADNKSIEEKYNKRIKNYLDLITTKIKIGLNEKQNAIAMLEEKKQKFVQAVSDAEGLLQQKKEKGEQISEEAYSQLEFGKQQIKETISKLNLITDKISNDIYLTKEEIDKIDKYYKYTFRDIKEEAAQKYLIYARNKLNINDEALLTFIDNLVTGNAAYFVDYEGGRIPTFKRLDFLRLYYPVEDTIKYVQDSSWCAIESMMTIPDIINQYGDILTNTQMDKIENSREWYQNSAMISMPNGDAVFNNNSTNVSSGATCGNIRVWKVYWQSQRVINVKKSPNKYNNKEHIHFLIGKDEEQIYDKTYKLKKDETITKRYVNDLYEGVLIGADIFANCRKHRFPLRKEDDLSYTQIPVVAKTHSSLTDRAYSLIWATKDIQKLYNIVHYHRELMLAMAGTKTLVMDMAQMPDNMTPAEWEYQLKIGRMFIQSRKKGERQPINFNQFQSFDMSVGPGIQYLENILQGLIQMVQMIMGVTPQAMGQIGQYDPVGTSEMSINQSSLITEIKYYEHDELQRLALERFMNLSAKYCLKKDMIYQFIDSDFASEIVKLHEDFEPYDFELFVRNNLKEEQKMQELRQMVVQGFNKNVVNLPQVISMFNLETTKELEKKLEEFTKQGLKLQAENAQQGMQMQQQVEESKIKLQGDISMKLEQMKQEYQKGTLELEKQKMQMLSQIEGLKLEVEKQKIQSRNQSDLLKTSSERDTEYAYLQNEDKHATIDQEIKLAQLELQKQQMELDHLNGIKERKQEHIEHIDKIRIDEKAIDKKSKEKII